MKITNAFTTSDIQKKYRKIFNLTKKSGPVLVITNNRPDVVIMGYRQFVELAKNLEDYEYQETMRLLKHSSSTSSNNKLTISYSKTFQEKRNRLPLLIKKTLLKKEQAFRSNTTDPTLTIQVFKSDLPDTFTLGITDNLAIVFRKETKSKVKFINIINQVGEFYSDNL